MTYLIDIQHSFLNQNNQLSLGGNITEDFSYDVNLLSTLEKIDLIHFEQRFRIKLEAFEVNKINNQQVLFLYVDNEHIEKNWINSKVYAYQKPNLSIEEWRGEIGKLAVKLLSNNFSEKEQNDIFLEIDKLSPDLEWSNYIFWSDDYLNDDESLNLEKFLDKIFESV